MPLRCPSEQLADYRDHLRLSTGRAGDQEDQLEAFVAAAERDMRRADAALSHTADGVGEATRDARVIAYTGKPSFNDRPTPPSFAALLAKPSTPGALLATVRHAAGLRAPPRGDGQRFPNLEVESFVPSTGRPDFMELSMHNVREHAVACLAVHDEDVASRSPARLLITASTHQGVETLARRVHGGGPRAQFPFVRVCAGELPVERDVLKEYCSSLLAAAAGGSILINAVEEMPPVVQDALIELLAGQEFARGAFAEVRLISGTTVSLFDRVAAGAFSDRLYYQLNIIHVSAGGDRADAAHS